MVLCVRGTAGMPAPQEEKNILVIEITSESDINHYIDIELSLRLKENKHTILVQ